MKDIDKTNQRTESVMAHNRDVNSKIAAATDALMKAVADYEKANAVVESLQMAYDDIVHDPGILTEEQMKTFDAFTTATENNCKAIVECAKCYENREAIRATLGQTAPTVDELEALIESCRR